MTNYVLIAKVAGKTHFDQYLAHFQKISKGSYWNSTPNASWRKFNVRLSEMSQRGESKESRFLIYDVTQKGEVVDTLIFEAQVKNTPSTGVLISPLPDQEGNKLGSMSGTRAISTTSRRELSSSFFFFLCKARHRRKFTPFWQKH